MKRIRTRRRPVVSGLAILLSATFTAEASRAQSATLQGDWVKILQAAKKEGQVVVYGAPGEELLYRQFENKHPGIKVVFISGGGERPHQIITERRAGKYLADVYIGGVGPLYKGLYKSGILDPIKEVLMLPEVVDESKWRGGRHVYLDDEKKYILAFNEVVQHYFHYNTTSVDPSQFTSYWNLLDRKWKGKILAWDPLDAGAEGVVRFLYYNPDIGPEFLRRFFTEMELTVTRDVRQFVDWLAAGRFLIAGPTDLAWGGPKNKAFR